jgi:hypothetical protein
LRIATLAPVCISHTRYCVQIYIKEVPQRGHGGKGHAASSKMIRKVHIVEASEDKLKQLRDADDEDVELQLMISAAQTLETLAAAPHAAVLVSQGCLLVAITALT